MRAAALTRYLSLGKLSARDAKSMFQSPTGNSTEGAPLSPHHATETLERVQRMAAFEGKNFDPIESTLTRQANIHRSHKDYSDRYFYQWLIPCLIGISMGGIAFFVDWGIEYLVSLKYETTKKVIYRSGGFLAPYCTYMAFVILYALGAGALVSYGEPLATGSGIPELKTYLNGVHLKNLLHVRTLVAKLVGITLSIGSGLIAGKEGPFVHGGGIVGSGIGSMTSRAFNFKVPRKFGGMFRNEVDHRDFTSIGTAAGVATAFAAPIGGALFTIEEGCSFYSTYVFWRCFLATCCGVVTLHCMAEYRRSGGSLGSAKLGTHRDFGLYSDDIAHYGSKYWYYAWEIPIFVGLGVMGGLLGALFVHLNTKVTMFRQKYIPGAAKAKRLYEVVLIAAVTGTLFFITSYGSPCAWLPRDADAMEVTNAADFLAGDVVVTDSEHRYFPRLWCPEGKYSTYGQLFFVPLAEALRLLLHLGESVEEVKAQEAEWDFSMGPIWVFLLLCSFLMTWTYGVGAATGLFVPSLSVGAAMGHIVGRTVQGIVGVGSDIDPKAYAVLGAAASLGGATRMTLSITVLVMETTGALQLVVPIMLVIFVSKAVGDMINLGIYDTHIKIRGAPLLEENGLNPEQKMLMDKLKVDELMVDEIVTLPVRPSCAEVLNVLKGNRHSAFPVVVGDQIHGLVERSMLLKMMEHKVFAAKEDVEGRDGRDELPSTQEERIALIDKLNPRSDGPVVPPEILSGMLSDTELDSVLNLSNYMNKHPVVVPSDASVSRAYRLFRTLGMRHMLVGDAHPRLRGLLTRKDLTEENAELFMGEKAALNRRRGFSITTA